MDSKEVDRFERLQAQLNGLYNEMSTLSKKKPDDALNTFKLGFVNQVLVQINDLFGEENRPFSGYQRFDEDDVPTNSDVVFILTQYSNCLEKVRADNITSGYGGWYWIIDGKESTKKLVLHTN